MANYTIQQNGKSKVEIDLKSRDENQYNQDFPIDLIATVQAALVLPSDTVTPIKIGPESVLSGTSGSDWPTGKIVAVFDSTDTEPLAVGDEYIIEVYVNDATNDNEVYFHFTGVEVVRTYIR